MVSNNDKIIKINYQIFPKEYIDNKINIINSFLGEGVEVEKKKKDIFNYC